MIAYENRNPHRCIVGESRTPNGDFTSRTFLERNASVARTAEQPRTPTAVCLCIILSMIEIVKVKGL